MVKNNVQFNEFKTMRAISILLAFLAILWHFIATGIEITTRNRIYSEFLFNSMENKVAANEANRRIAEVSIYAVRRGFAFSMPCEILLLSAFIILLVDSRKYKKD